MNTDPIYYNDLISRYLSGEASLQEIREMIAWTQSDPEHRKYFEALRKTWLLLEQEKVDNNYDPGVEWLLMESRIDFTERPLSFSSPGIKTDTQEAEFTGSNIPHTGFLRTLSSRALRIAALVVILAVPSFFIYRYYATPKTVKLTADSGTISTRLPDGTMVTLFTGALLEYPSFFKGMNREVNLMGEAYFEVHHDASSPFIISTGNIRVEDIGTSFDINTKTPFGTLEVILTEGKVALYNKQNPERKEFLAPGEKADVSLIDNRITKEVNQDENYLAWKTKKIIFRDDPMNEVVALLSKVYQANIRLKDPGLENCRITVTFDNQSLESVLNVIKSTLDVSVITNGSTIEITGKGCIH